MHNLPGQGRTSPGSGHGAAGQPRSWDVRHPGGQIGEQSAGAARVLARQDRACASPAPLALAPAPFWAGPLRNGSNRRPGRFPGSRAGQYDRKVSDTGTGAPRAGDAAAGTFDPTVASIARIYDYWLGGKDNFAVDREAAEQAIAANPGIKADVRANRAFLARVVRFLAGERGVRQFLDIGTGLPTVSNTHQVAQAVAPACRVVYVDHDPVVLAHAQALLTSTPEGATAYLDHDLREVGQILQDASATLDLSQPVALMLLIVLHLIPDGDDPGRIVGRLMDQLAPGSYLVISHPASDIRPAAMAEMARRVNSRLASARGTMRDREQITRFFDGLSVLEPGVVQPQQWRPEDGLSQSKVTAWCAVARKE